MGFGEGRDGLSGRGRSRYSDCRICGKVEAAWAKERVWDLPKGSNVVPFWVCYGFWGRNDNILPKKELHRRVWV